ncbi:MAG: dipeptidase [Heliobacteriaceae bacterium]|nr:dipeptidase [Heliobacteriaceae bacterium]MDD4587892.1 dipeptidase [Heliobacteriaceae bacterium]
MCYPVVDAHCDTLGHIAAGGFDFTGSTGAVSRQAFAAGEVVLQFFAAYVDSTVKNSGPLCQALRMINSFHVLVADPKNGLAPVLERKDLDVVVTGQRGGLLAIEGGEALENCLEIVDVFFRLGVRSLGLTWNRRNALADGCGVAGPQRGLTPFGRQVVRRIQALGILADLAHLAPAGFWDVMAVSSRPVIVSHTNCRRLCEHPRNLDDAQIKELARRGGVMGVSFYPDFLAADPDTATIDTVVEHIDYACQVAGGYTHVGIGSDFDGIDRIARGIVGAASFPVLWELLQKKGYTEAQIRGIAGENFLRVLRQALPGRLSG